MVQGSILGRAHSSSMRRQWCSEGTSTVVTPHKLDTHNSTRLSNSYHPVAHPACSPSTHPLNPAQIRPREVRQLVQVLRCLLLTRLLPYHGRHPAGVHTILLPPVAETDMSEYGASSLQPLLMRWMKTRKREKTHGLLPSWATLTTTSEFTSIHFTSRP